MLVDLIFPDYRHIRPVWWTGELDEFLAGNSDLPSGMVEEVRAALASPDRETGLMGGGAGPCWLLRAHEEDE